MATNDDFGMGLNMNNPMDRSLKNGQLEAFLNFQTAQNKIMEEAAKRRTSLQQQLDKKYHVDELKRIQENAAAARREEEETHKKALKNLEEEYKKKVTTFNLESKAQNALTKQKLDDIAKEDKRYSQFLEDNASAQMDIMLKLDKAKRDSTAHWERIETIRLRNEYAQMSLSEKKYHQSRIENRTKEHLQELKAQEQAYTDKIYKLKQEEKEKLTYLKNCSAHSEEGLQLAQEVADLSAQQQALDKDREKLLEQINKEQEKANTAAKIAQKLGEELETREYSRLGIVDKFNRKIQEQKDITNDIAKLEDAHSATQVTNEMRLLDAQKKRNTLAENLANLKKDPKASQNDIQEAQKSYDEAAMGVMDVRSQMEQEDNTFGENKAKLVAKSDAANNEIGSITGVLKNGFSEILKQQAVAKQEEASLKLKELQAQEKAELKQAKGDKDVQKAIKQKYATKKEGPTKDKASAEELLESLIGSGFIEALTKDTKGEDLKNNADFGKKFGENITAALGNTLSALGDKVNQMMNQIDDNITSFYSYQAGINARLQGSSVGGNSNKRFIDTQDYYQKVLKVISKNVGFSGYMAQKDVVENIKRLVDEGIAYDLEYRGFLATLSEDIATTFNALDETLLRVVRLQQADTTAARLGMEASLTKFLNGMFNDTSYLKNVYDTVSGALIEANSQLSRDQSIEFEYMMQKWLGALYSVGLSSEAVSQIATGVGYLSTGNVDALNGNESLQTLLAMASNRAGLSYASMLTNGVTGDNANKLMAAMITYLKEIAQNTTSNKVVESAYGNLLGFSLSDFTAISNLSSVDIDSIATKTENYASAMNELDTQLSSITKRVHLSQVIKTAVDNAMMSAATSIGNNAGVYTTWMITNIIEDLTGGIAIPAISVMGNMVDLHQTVTGLVKAGMAGVSLMGSLISGVAGGTAFGTTDKNKWGYDEYTSRGTAPRGVLGGVARGISQSEQLSSVANSGGDMQSATLASATDDAQEIGKTTNKNAKNAITVETLYKGLFEEHLPIMVQSSQFADFSTKLFSDGLIHTVTQLSESVFDPIISELNKIVTRLNSTLTVQMTAQMQYAKGSVNAQKGIALVGEQGPELVLLNGGESIYSHNKTNHLLKNQASLSDSTSIFGGSSITDFLLSNLLLNEISYNKSPTSSSLATIDSSSSSLIGSILQGGSQTSKIQNSNVSKALAISALEQKSNSLCTSIEDLYTVITQPSQNTKDNNVNVKLSEIDEAVETKLKNYVEQKLSGVLMSAILKGLMGNEEQDIPIGAMLKNLLDRPLDVNVKNNNFDELLMSLLFKNNY